MRQRGVFSWNGPKFLMRGSYIWYGAKCLLRGSYGQSASGVVRGITESFLSDNDGTNDGSVAG